jgi:hypothetical protein
MLLIFDLLLKERVIRIVLNLLNRSEYGLFLNIRFECTKIRKAPIIRCEGIEKIRRWNFELNV